MNRKIIECRRHGLVPAILMSFLPLSGCGFYTTDYEISITMPDLFAVEGLGDQTRITLPDSGIFYWDVSWLDRAGSVSRRRVGSRDAVLLLLPKEQPVIIRASPEIPGLPASFSFRPAGCLRPADLPVTNSISLTWEEGFSAHFMLELARNGVDPSCLNIRKFQETVRLRGGEYLWHLDMRQLVSDVIEGNLWIYSFRLPSAHPVHLPLPAGYWYSEYLPERPLESHDDGWDGEIFEGLNHFLGNSGYTCVAVFVDERGEITLLSEDTR